MALLNSTIQQQVREALAAMKRPVKLLMFTQGANGVVECAFCAETRALLEEVAALSDKLTLEVRDFVADAALAEAYRIDKIPAVAVLGDGAQPKDYGIRLYGIPSGYEFGTLIEDILMVSRGEAGLQPQTMNELKRLDAPVHIQVFVTPTCPYCPRAVLLAHKLALASDWITADMVEATEFPHLANKYGVYGVPRTVINETIHIEGAVPEATLVAQLMAARDKPMAQR
ncbi:MAG: protein disulfide oxidoreductase [Thermoflexales bacterium]